MMRSTTGQSEVPAVAWELMETFWPGPLTLILKKQAWVPSTVTGGQDTVGLRVPGHPVALELLRRFAAVAGEHGGIAAPSANRFGRISPTTAAHVQEELGDRVSLDSGRRAVRGRHRIDHRRLLARRTRRLAARPYFAAHLEAVFGRVLAIRTADEAPRVSGSLAAHYAPQTPMRLIAGERLLDFLNAQRHKGDRCGVITHSQPPQAGMPHVWQLLAADPVAYAHELYATLREMDHAGVALIVVEALPDTAGWAAVADRLRRAVAGSGGT